MHIRRISENPGSLPPVKPPAPASSSSENQPADKALQASQPEATADSSQLESKNGKALTSVSLMTRPEAPMDGSQTGAKVPKAKAPASTGPKLTAIEVGGSILNDSNMFVKHEDDLGMTTSYAAHAHLDFANSNGSQTHVDLNNRSALHTQFLSQEHDLTHQSTLTVNEYEAGIRNNAWLMKSPHFSTGARLQYKSVDTNPASGWANVQAGLHSMAHLRQYQNHQNPFVGDQSYLTPMATLNFEDEKIKGHLYLKTEAETALGTMIPLQQRQDFKTPLRGDLSGSVKFGYAYRDKPLIYMKLDGNLSNDPLPYNRDQGTLGSAGLALGNEFTLMKRKNMDVNLFLETKVIQPFGNLPNNPLPDQPGKHDLLHEMFNLKLQLKLK